MAQTYTFEQIHLDVARNATDDFNPFHDPHRWRNIRGNPYGGPIILGFQLAALVDHLIETQRGSEPGGSNDAADYLNYEFHYAGPLRPGESFRVDVRRTLRKPQDAGSATNRVVVRTTEGRPVLLGARTDTMQPLVRCDGLAIPERTDRVEDRSYLKQQGLFLKRKYLNTSNGKNFLLGALVDQHAYFDEIAERVRFPPLFTAALLSCALLERAHAEGYDFEARPQVYVSHRITVDQRLQRSLRSNDRLDLLVDAATPVPVRGNGGLAQPRVEQELRHCVASIEGRGVLFRAQVQLAPLEAIQASRGAESP